MELLELLWSEPTDAIKNVECGQIIDTKARVRFQRARRAAVGRPKSGRRTATPRQHIVRTSGGRLRVPRPADF